MGRVPPELAKPLQRYLSLFRPRARALAWARGRKLLGELVGAIEAGAINRHGRDWPAPAATWVTAIEVILAKRETLQLPLKSHGYLLEIISGHADKAEAGIERDREAEMKGASVAQRNKLQQAQQEIASEKRARLRLHQPPLSPDEERAIYSSFGVEQRP